MLKVLSKHTCPIYKCMYESTATNAQGIQIHLAFTIEGKDGLTELWFLLCEIHSGQDEAQMPGRKAASL